MASTEADFASPVDRPPDPERPNPPLDGMIRREKRNQAKRAYKKALTSLTATQLRAWTLYADAGLSTAKIAALMGSSRRAANALLARVQSRLASALGMDNFREVVEWQPTPRKRRKRAQKHGSVVDLIKSNAGPGTARSVSHRAFTEHAARRRLEEQRIIREAEQAYTDMRALGDFAMSRAMAEKPCNNGSDERETDSSPQTGHWAWMNERTSSDIAACLEQPGTRVVSKRELTRVELENQLPPLLGEAKRLELLNQTTTPEAVELRTKIQHVIDGLKSFDATDTLLAWDSGSDEDKAKFEAAAAANEQARADSPEMRAALLANAKRHEPKAQRASRPPSRKVQKLLEQNGGDHVATGKLLLQDAENKKTARRARGII